MATNNCVKYPFSLEWTTEIPFENMPRRSPNIIFLDGVECNLELKMLQERYYLDIVLPKREELKMLTNFTVTTFIRDSTYSDPILSAYKYFWRPVQQELFPGPNKFTLANNETLWSKSKSEILIAIPNIFNIGKLTMVCVFHSTDTQLDKNHSTHVSTQTTLSSVVSVDLQSLSRDLSTFLKDETFSDVKLMCANRTFSANRSVLAARSEVFAAMFRNKMAETEVHIKDTDPEVLEMLLNYVYSAEMPVLCEETALYRLYEAADKYAVHSLRRACSDRMVNCQRTDNCLDFLVLGDNHSDENFKEAVACFVAEHLADLNVESWSTFSDNYPQLVITVLKKLCEDSMPGAAKRAESDFQ